MRVADKIQSGLTFWAGEDGITEYNFYPNTQFPEGFIQKNGSFFCSVKTFTEEYMEVYLQFFGIWQVSKVHYTDVAFSQLEIIQRIQPINQ